jgi:ADP-ribose 1''-phosphate phosphatase
MNQLNYKIGNLFSAPPEAFLLHSCNCVGAFGAGVAKSFKNLYPDLYKQYNAYCNQNLKNEKRSSILGQSFIAIDTDTARKMICLFTSQGYGSIADPVDTILESTERALEHLSQNPIITSGNKIEIHSPKINSGLFRVSWPSTELKIKQFLKNNPNVTWTVWSLN